MTESIGGYGFSADFFTADITVNNEIIRTVIYAIGIDFVFFNSFSRSMTECFTDDRCSFEFIAANIAVNHKVIRACIHAVGADNVFFDSLKRIMAESGNCAFIFSLTTVVTNGNFLAFVFAIGSNGLFILRERVTESTFRYGFSADFFTADTVNNKFIRAVFFAGGGNFVFFG